MTEPAGDSYVRRFLFEELEIRGARVFVHGEYGGPRRAPVVGPEDPAFFGFDYGPDAVGIDRRYRYADDPPEPGGKPFFWRLLCRLASRQGNQHQNNRKLFHIHCVFF